MVLPIDPLRSFALFDDARDVCSSPSRLLTDIEAVITLDEPGQWPQLAQRLRQASANGLYIGGWLSYEAGYAFEQKLAPLSHQVGEAPSPLAWFGLYRQCRLIPAQDMEAYWRTVPLSLSVQPARAAIFQQDYQASVEKIINYINAGDVYQVNYTFPAELEYLGTPLSLYRRLREAQRASHSALIWTGAQWVVSLSPELFFTLDQGRLLTRPMKGTAPRKPHPKDDDQAAQTLMLDSKNRAENLMIVDLIRNDLSRVAAVGSVKTQSLFEKETYPTLHQMTSTVTANLAPGLDALDVIERLFPCGSVTGAPKIRAMEIIVEIENAPRGLYTGSIGWIAPSGDASFNVAIRTLELTSANKIRLGLGSGIVADSNPAEEWQECLLKGRFSAVDLPTFDLFETLGWTPENSFIRLDRHLERLAQSARYWGFADTIDLWRTALMKASANWTSPMRVRLLISRFGAITLQASPLPPAPQQPVSVCLSPLIMTSDNVFLAHKTSHRAWYDDERLRLQAATGCFDVLFQNERGELTEGSFTSLFLEKSGKFVTPPLSSGVLPGILRAELIESGQVEEQIIKLDDLIASDNLWIGNSLRGLIRAHLLPHP